MLAHLVVRAYMSVFLCKCTCERVRVCKCVHAGLLHWVVWHSRWVALSCYPHGQGMIKSCWIIKNVTSTMQHCKVIPNVLFSPFFSPIRFYERPGSGKGWGHSVLVMDNVLQHWMSFRKAYPWTKDPAQSMAVLRYFWRCTTRVPDGCLFV